MKHRGEKRKFHFGMPDHDSGNAAGAIAPPKTNPEGYRQHFESTIVVIRREGCAFSRIWNLKRWSLLLCPML